jgi:hypothetical protein
MQVVFLFFKASRPDLGPTHPPNRWVPVTRFAGSKRLVLEANHSPHVMPRSRMSGGRPLLPPFAVIWCRGIAVTLRLLITWIVLSATCCTVLCLVMERNVVQQSGEQN